MYLDTIAAHLFTILKISVFTLSLLTLIFIFIKIYTQQGVVIIPFEISKNENISGIAIADQLTAELMQIQKIHKIETEKIINSCSTDFSSEESLGIHEMIVPKSEIVEFNMANIGTISVGSNSLALGNLIIAFKNICPGNKPVTTIRGSLQRYGSIIVLVAVLEDSHVQSWIVRQLIDDNNNEEQLNEMIKNLAFRITYDLLKSCLSAKTWEGLKYYTEALGAYHQYNMSGNTDDLFLASKYSLMAIRSEKEYKKPFDLLSALELRMLQIKRQNDAIEYCNKTLELNPVSVYSWCNKGTTLNVQGKYDEAIKCLDEAIRLDPNYAAWINKGYALNSQGKYDEAIKCLDEAIRLDPKYTEAWVNKGNVLKAIGRTNEADAAFAKAQELGNTD